MRKDHIDKVLMHPACAASPLSGGYYPYQGAAGMHTLFGMDELAPFRALLRPKRDRHLLGGVQPPATAALPVIRYMHLFGRRSRKSLEIDMRIHGRPALIFWEDYGSIAVV
jgi:hypothetical protein